MSKNRKRSDKIDIENCFPLLAYFPFAFCATVDLIKVNALINDDDLTKKSGAIESHFRLFVIAPVEKA